ncbi:m-AAA protease-interacting protein 1 [Huso huso]|uniref:M-AAA protease-interacting protein 1 n=1 Tax=Huso huso TaxID=61971 RepID=A0ABR0ZDT7_HUSHU
MALPIRNCCVRAHGILSNFLKHGSGSSLLIPVVIKGPPSASAACRLGRAPALSAARLYSSEPQRTNQKMVVVGIPNPFIWCRTRVYYFLIRAYFDQEFNIDDFTEGAKHAFARVSNLLSQCKFEALEGLVAKDVLERLQQQCPLLPQTHQQALAADMSDIMYTTPGDVGIYYDDNGRKFVSILMRFWYLTSARLPEETPEGTKVFQVAFGEEERGEETKRLLTANYEFQREFTKGVLPDWTITRIEHSKLLD